MLPIGQLHFPFARRLGMTATAVRDELRGPVLAGIGGAAAEAAHARGTVVSAALLPECGCFYGDCDRDHDNE
jgi:hypothetical protein